MDGFRPDVYWLNGGDTRGVMAVRHNAGMITIQIPSRDQTFGGINYPDFLPSPLTWELTARLQNVAFFPF